MRRFRLLMTSTVASVFAAFGVVASAEAADYFLEINGVPGESQDAKQAKSVDVLSYTWGASRTPTPPGGGGGAARPELKQLTIEKRVDVTSPPLFRRLAAGQVIPHMELIGRKAGAAQQIFLRYCFQQVQVTSIQHSDAAGSTLPTENVSFFYAAVSEQYTRQNPDGSIGQTVFAGWNATSGTLITTYPAPCGF
jgi:type VI secretion system secreted protein Hcp